MRPPLSPPIVLRGVYFLIFFGLGVYFPFFNLYLQSLGLSGAQIGAILALIPLGSVVAPPIGGLLADYFRRRNLLIALLTAGSAMVFAGVLVAREFYLLAGICLLFSALRNPAVPLIEGATFEYLSKARGDYGRIRLWGSFGFIVGVLAIGYLVEVFTIRAMVYIYLAGSLLQFFLVLDLPSEGGPRPKGLGKDVLSLLRAPGFSLFLLAGFLLRTSHGTFWTFFAIHLKALGISGGVTGLAFALGVLAEVLFLTQSRRLLGRTGIRGMLILSALAAALRWFLYSVTGSALPILAISLLHGLSFGAYHVAGTQYADLASPGTLKSSGQAFFSAATYGAGGIAGAALAGAFFEAWGVVILFRWAALVALLSALLFTLGLKAGHPRSPLRTPLDAPYPKTTR